MSIDYDSSDVTTGMALVEFQATVPWEGVGYNCYNDDLSGSRQEGAYLSRPPSVGALLSLVVVERNALF